MWLQGQCLLQPAQLITYQLNLALAKDRGKHPNPKPFMGQLVLQEAYVGAESGPPAGRLQAPGDGLPGLSASHGLSELGPPCLSTQSFSLPVVIICCFTWLHVASRSIWFGSHCSGVLTTPGLEPAASLHCPLPSRGCSPSHQVSFLPLILHLPGNLVFLMHTVDFFFFLDKSLRNLTYCISSLF